MAGPPFFQRSPRLSPQIPGGEIDIPAPPAAPAAPSMSLGYLAPAIIGTLLSLGLPILLSGFLPGGRGYQATYLLFSLPMMLVSYIWPVVGHVQQKRAFQRSTRVREEKYRGLLQTHRTQLEQLWCEQQEAMRTLSPDPAECLRRVKERDPRLWERSPDDPDFLQVRLGIGAAPFAVTVKTPKPNPADVEPDPLAQEAESLVSDFASVAQVPVSLPLGELGLAGIVGAREHVLSEVRSFIMQLVTHHSPDQVKIVAVFPERETDQWAWMRWVPHVWSEDGRRRYLAADRESATRMLGELHDILARRLAREQEGALPRFVFILADPAMYENTPILPLLLEGSACSLFTARGREELPRECRAIVQVAGQGSEIIWVGGGRQPTDYLPDAVPHDVCEYFSRTMAPIRLRRLATPSVVPDKVTLLDMFGISRVEELRVWERWNASDPGLSLAVPIGIKGGGEPLLLDLHERGHGPHGLVAGATGAGKSELLQTLIAALAIHFHPYDLSFILVDYKGGALANVFRDLPHLIGSINNLQGNLATRALTALKGELRRRQSLLGQASVNHVDDYQRLYREGRAAEPMPHLVFIVDEFAELKAEQPDFMRELVSAVRVGRSLGVHLILATQKPAGVVDDQIWSNARFRLCLRVERPEDSREVLKRPEAADLTTPGRAYIQVGNDESFDLFQAAWGGAPYIPGGPVTNTGAIAEVVLDGSRYELSSRPKPKDSQGQQLQILVGYLAETARQAGIAPLPGPWLPPLPDELSLDELPREGGWDGHSWRPGPTWVEPVAGRMDDPQHQQQGALRINLGREGHLAVYGAPGTGKTTFLQTLITSLALQHSPGDVHLYLLDFGGRVLSMFADLPHVGAVILVDEEERLNRLIRYLFRETDLRKEAFGRHGVTTLAAYRSASGEPMPAIVIVLDNYQALAGTYPDAEDALGQLTRDGSSLGIHLVLTANTYTAVPTRVNSNIMLAVALQQNDPGDYAMIVGRTGGVQPMALPGRGLVKHAPPLEFQTALPFPGETEIQRNQALRSLVRAMAGAWTGPRPRTIALLPEVVHLANLLDAPGPLSPAVPVGLEAESLEPLALDLRDGPHFLISGPPESGKTTFLQTWLLSLAASASGQFYLVDFRGEGLADLQGLPQLRGLITEDDGLTEALAEISLVLKERRQAGAGHGDYPPLVMAIDNFDAFRDGAGAAAKDELERMVRRERGLGFHLLLAGTCDDLGSSWEGLVKAVKELQTGVILGTADHSDLQILNLRFPAGEGGKLLPAGLGFYGRRGRARKFRAATPHPVRAMVERLKQEVDS